jgi:hypothetical protein
MRNQIKDIKLLRRLSFLLKKYKFIQKLPGLATFAFGNHTVIGDGEFYFNCVLKEMGKRPKNSLDYYSEELLSNSNLKNAYLEAVENGLIPNKYPKYEDRITRNPANVVNYYALIREIQPNIIVETGTASGSMTSWVLAALSMNLGGKLISIDIPPQKGKLTMDMGIDKDRIGFLIPRSFHHFWDYRIGDAKILLPKTLADYNVDVFIHDSLHTRTHMLFEFNVARTLLRHGAVIMSDDILWNKAWLSFLNSHNLRGFSCQSNPNLGFAVNVFEEFELNVGTGIVSIT